MTHGELRDSRGRWRTEGRRLLLELVARCERTQLAERLDITPCLLGHYCTGRKRPSLDVAGDLEREGIPMKSWTVANTTGGSRDPELDVPSSDSSPQNAA